MALWLSLLAALSYGCSDFVGGLASHRAPPWAVALTAQLGGGVAVLAVALVQGGSPQGHDLTWAVLAGVGNGVGTAFLYRGLSSGRMGVVAPVSGVGAAALPVVVAVLTGERPALLVWTGLLVAGPAIWLVSREPDVGSGTRPAGGLADGLLAGAGFGTLFAALAQIDEGAGLLPLALNQVVAAVVVVVVATGLAQAWAPRDAAAYAGVVSGVLGVLATVLFLVATRHGLLAVSAVITSLYPAFTVALAAALLRERVHRAQGVGLGLCALAVALVAAG